MPVARQRFAKSDPARRLALKADEGDGVARQRKALKEMLHRFSAERDQVLLDPGRMTGGDRLTEALPLLGGQGKGQALPALQPALAVGRDKGDVDAFEPCAAHQPDHRHHALQACLLPVQFLLKPDTGSLIFLPGQPS
jgi:hypothetical protein